MNRQWKSKPTHLPGWSGYQIPKHYGLEDRKAKQNTRFTPHANKRRLWFKKKAKQRRNYQRYVHEVECRKVPFAEVPRGTRVKLLRIQAGPNAFDCLFERHQGVWSCSSAPEPFEWFTRVNHVHLIGEWLRKHRYPFHWLSLTGNTAPNRSPGQTRGSCTRAEPSPLSESPERPQDDQSLHDSGLAQNGLATPRCLIRQEDLPRSQPS